MEESFVKKVISIIITMLTMILCPLFTVDQKSDTRRMDIRGTLGPVHTMTITSIPRTSLADPDGMPFDLRSDDLQISPGRKIANWTLTSNYMPVTLRINAPDLVSETYDDVSIPYTLRFSYSYPEYHMDSSITTEIGAFYVNSSDNEEFSYQFKNSEDVLQGLEIIATGTCNIYFILGHYNGDSFEEKIDISDSKYPTGDYSTTVTVILEAPEI